jgi:signal transduction histidine kinase
MVFERTVSVPDQPVAALELPAAELRALGGVAVAGEDWLAAWAPSLGPGPRDGLRRVAPAVNAGAVLGFVVVERSVGAARFSEEQDRALVEVGRWLGERLHTRRLDTTLQSTLDDLRASRARLVATADAERRRIERNLHDGAQQHLVALAVSLRLARDLVGDDPDASRELLDQLRHDVVDTIQQLRDLAHGIYPPLLMDAGLGEALHAAAQRSPQPASVHAEGTRRYAADVEAAVYFCCLEAMQNAAKHAPGASIRIELREVDRTLRFDVIDDGPGFDPAAIDVGQGFQNMADRVGAIGGQVRWQASPGAGTRVSGVVPAALPAALPAREGVHGVAR